ncbi:hypothetical protein [Bacteroides sp. 41_26]|uniref:hypothetical protein n=1 Tax=Bacteroides sp. 41_26 TaxID=1896973 RepID=UPI00259D1745|nr:hypothetical protein [Bacteroides sp. 41_26]
MIVIELYINGKLCDLPGTFNIRINRQFINPQQLTLKDAQYSYSITLPPTFNNNSILGFIGVEEVVNKFNRRYNAELSVNGARIFKGYFRLSEIGATGYKGNLYTPNSKTSKDIFPSEKWEDMTGYYIDFGLFSESVTAANTKALEGAQPAIFPYVLYGLLPKVDRDGYGERDEWDSRVSLSWDDVPPSLNVSLLLKKVFEIKGMLLTGDYQTDKYLNDIYVSYKNDPTYELPWNYRNSSIIVAGKWFSVDTTGGEYRNFEKNLLYTDNKESVSAMVTGGTNNEITQVIDNVGVVDDGAITVPVSGYYKVRLSYDLQLHTGGQMLGQVDTDTGVCHVTVGSLQRRVFELRLMRGINSLNDLSDLALDSTLYRNNLPQEPNSPKRYYPVNGTSLIVDEMQDQQLVFGVTTGSGEHDSVYRNPTYSGIQSAVLLKSPFLSWSEDGILEADKRAFSLFPNEGYYLVENGITESSDKFKIEVVNGPGNFSPSLSDTDASGTVEVIAWLDKGERLSLISVVECHDTIIGSESVPAVSSHRYNYRIELIPYRSDRGWIPASNLENGTLPILNWEDAPTFESDRIDLFKFMPQNEKVSDFIDNLCTTFNLRIVDAGDNTFFLEKGVPKIWNQYVDLDGIGAVAKRSNSALNLPSQFILSFTVNEDEEGYYVNGNTGVSGSITTGAIEGNPTEQKSPFSYNWFKRIKKDKAFLDLPVISKHEVWTEDRAYKDAMEEKYTDLAQRFWFYGGIFSADINGKSVFLAKVTNTKGLILSYENKKFTILDLYFATLVNADSHYTEIECYLSPVHYEMLKNYKKALFNHDIYYVAELSGYDPTGRNKTKVKLIKKI